MLPRDRSHIDLIKKVSLGLNVRLNIKTKPGTFGLNRKGVSSLPTEGPSL